MPTSRQNSRSDPDGPLQSSLQAKAETIPPQRDDRWSASSRGARLRKRFAFVSGNDAEGATFHGVVHTAKNLAGNHDLLDSRTRAPASLERIVIVEHARLRIHGVATLFHGDADRRRLDLGLHLHGQLGLRLRYGGPAQR